MNAKQSIAALTLSLGAAAAPWLAGTAAAADFSSSRTRAEVIAELKQAQTDGSYVVGGEEFPGQLLGNRQLAQAAAAQSGLWLTQSGNLEVEIAPCGQALCGTVVRAISNQAMSPNSSSSSSGPSQAADTRPAQGMTILLDFRQTSAKEWKGHIYNRQNGETYDCQMTLAGPDQLQLRIYKGDPQAGQTQLWTRVAAGAGHSTDKVAGKAAP
ncbi:MAG: DUF2147 domain-containing protein [Pseudomonadota bacterium]